jgi:hypothetical protein
MPKFSGLVEVQDGTGTTTVSIDPNQANIYLGGAKPDGSARTVICTSVTTRG